MEVFYTSPWVPPEWIKAHGLEPRGIWLARDFACEPLPLASGVCAFANAVVRMAERHAESAVIFTTHCDQLRRGFDTVVGAAAVSYTHLPRLRGRVFEARVALCLPTQSLMASHPQSGQEQRGLRREQRQVAAGFPAASLARV